MGDVKRKLQAGRALKALIKARYASQQEFADDYGLELRTVNRYVNEGIRYVDVIQELADFFRVDFAYFFSDLHS